MSAQDPHPLIVVGYDGSPASDAALNRAVARAGGTGRVIVVHAYSAPNDYLGRLLLLRRAGDGGRLRREA
jgi:nucleotide-binding universal stress UspA family protein